MEGWGTGLRIEEFREDGERRWSRTEMASCAPDLLKAHWEGRLIPLHFSLPFLDKHEHLALLLSLVFRVYFYVTPSPVPKIHFSEEIPLRGCLLTHKPALKG